MKYAGIIVDISHEKLDRTFQYSIPAELEEQVEIGSKVEILFNRRKITGYVVELSDDALIEPTKIKPIEGVVSDSVRMDSGMIKLAYWIKHNYGSTIINALKTVMPVKDKVKQDSRRTISLLISEKEAADIAMECDKKHKTAQARLLRTLCENPVTEYSLVMGKLNISASTVKSLEEKGYIEINSYEVFRNSINAGRMEKKNVELNSEQRFVTESIIEEIENNDNTPCLIKGVTGSGKTEVYMELISHVLAKGREVIVLIPEIALTYQTVMRFYSRFGDVVSIINSRLSKGEKYDRFRMAAEGRLKIMIGPRSALFTPFNNLGLIIIDEEHEGAYQSENAPRYHARETAIEIASMCGGKVILGSATPSLESYYRAKKGEYHLYRLNERAGNASLPDVDIVDLRDELRKGNRTVFSDRLSELIRDRLEKKEQIMLFLNRRGLKGFINCRSCGTVIKCPHCDVSLTEHSNNRLICHYCGYETSFGRVCPECGSKHIGTFKAGTQEVEKQTEQLFPGARVLRMDRDSTSGKDGHAAILEKFANGEADILIGTQMIVKGHDFSNVTLVGVLLADTSLHSQDYRASEVTFDILTQAAGRAGRGEKSGNVVIQTYDPESSCIRHAANQDFDSFYNEEIQYRQLLGYPPVKHMMSLRIACEDEALLTSSANILKEISDVEDNMQVIGPANATIYRINDIYYRMIYYKCSDNSVLVSVKDRIEKYIQENNMKNIKVLFDFR